MGVVSEKASAQRQELSGLNDDLLGFAKDVREGRVAPPVGSTLVQIYNTVIRAIEQERKVRELDELQERIEVLEGRET